jgi:MFS family permease
MSNTPATESFSKKNGAAPGAGLALALLLAINLFNYIDRQNLSAVIPKLEATFLPDDPNAKAKLGALTFAFMVTYMILSPLFGWLGDRFSRWKLIGVGVILWSLASGLSGIAWLYPVMFFSRCFVGVGEAAYGPAAPSVISDLYPIEKRGSKMAWFYMAIPVGSALGFVLGGLVSDLLNWRWAFYLVVPPGVILGLLCLFMKEPPRGLASGAKRKLGLSDYLALVKIPSYVLNTAGMTAMTFVLGGVAAWMPAYLYDREARFELTPARLEKLAGAADAPPDGVRTKLESMKSATVLTQRELKSKLTSVLTPEEVQRHTSVILESTQTDKSPKLGEITPIFGGITALAGIIATLLGGIAGDRLRPRFSGSYFLVSGIGMLIGFPLFVAALFTPFPYAWLLLFAAIFFLFFNTGPTNTALANVTHPSVRASAFALNIFVIHALGDAISPFVIGAIADQSSLSTAILIVTLLVPVSGAFWLWGARYLKRDTDRIESGAN